jgi:E3 ubiquitin-protein ligase RNF14
MWARALDERLARAMASALRDELSRLSLDNDADAVRKRYEDNVDAQTRELEALVAVFAERAFGEDAEKIRLALESGETVELVSDVSAPYPRIELALSVDMDDDACVCVICADGALEVRALPMMFLDVTLPREYPSTAGPIFMLRCDWLSSSHLSALCARLDAIVEDETTRGEPVLFELAEYLQSNALREVLLNDNGALDLAASAPLGWGTSDDDGTNMSFEVDMRAIAMARDVQEAEFSILRADASARRHAFLESTNNTCCVCLADDILGRDLRRPSGCQHWLCVDCVRRMASVHVRDGSVTRLICPEPGCSSTFSPLIMREVLSNEDYEKYDTMLLSKTLDAMPDLVYCPRCEHPVLEDEGDGTHCGRCPGCMYAFCTLCRDAYHPPSIECLNPQQKLAVLEARRVGDEKMSAEALRKYREDLADAAAQAYVTQKGRLCPTCGAGVVKNEGCNKMTCACGSYFCWLCGDKLSGDGYAHFRNVDGEEGTSACRLFDLEEIERFEREMANMHLNGGRGVNYGDAGPRGRPADIVQCIRCKAANGRFDNNNHVTCWACQTSFCAACRAVVPRGSNHYGPGAGKCKQHAPLAR